MIQKENPKEILEIAYKKATKEIEDDNGKNFLNKLENHQRIWLSIIANKLESFKGVTSVLTTSLVKKIETPSQDVRCHQKSLKGGYSGRTLDTKCVTPFFKKRFRRLGMKEAGWLTRSLEQAHPYNFDYPGKIRNKEVKKAFLEILNDIEKNKEDPQKYLTGLFIHLIHQTTISKEKLIKHIPFKILDVNLIIECIKSHFFRKYHVSGASRLPVIAIYSIYQLMKKDVTRYKDKKLKSLKGHITADIKTGRLGDIDVVDKENKPFEAIEIKHNIPIDNIMIDDVYEKIKNTSITRYYLLTTAEPNKREGEENKIKDTIEKIKVDHGCEIIVNGIIPSLKYYLRLLQNPKEFIIIYTNNLTKEFSKTTEIKKEHIKAWEKIIKEKIN